MRHSSAVRVNKPEQIYNGDVVRGVLAHDKAVVGRCSDDGIAADPSRVVQTYLHHALCNVGIIAFHDRRADAAGQFSVEEQLNIIDTEGGNDFLEWLDLIKATRQLNRLLKRSLQVGLPEAESSTGDKLRKECGGAYNLNAVKK